MLAKALAWWTSFKERRQRKQLKERLLKERGCVLYCESCRDIIQSSAGALSPDLYEYVCDTCGHLMVFSYAYPVPASLNTCVVQSWEDFTQRAQWNRVYRTLWSTPDGEQKATYEVYPEGNPELYVFVRTLEGNQDIHSVPPEERLRDVKVVFVNETYARWSGFLK